MGAHLKKQNIFFYLSLLCSVATIVLMFLPWISIEQDGQQVSAALLPDFILQCINEYKLSGVGSMDALIFLIPLALGIIGVHVFYIISALRPNHDFTFPGTVTVLLAGIMFIVFVLTTDIGYHMLTVSNKEYTDNFLVFIGADRWTWVPVTWFLISLVQKLIFARFAHKKEVISYV